MVIRGNYNQRQSQLEAIAIRGNQRQSQSEAIAIRGTQRHSEAISWALACCSASSWRESRSTSAAPWVSRGDTETARRLDGAASWASRRRVGRTRGAAPWAASAAAWAPCWAACLIKVKWARARARAWAAAWAVAWVRAAPRAARLPRRARVYSPRRRRRAPARSELVHLMREAIKGVVRGHDDVHQAPREIGARSHRTARRCARDQGSL
jgi:hypothetical protein